MPSLSSHFLHFGRLSAESAREAPTAQKWQYSRFFAQVASAPSAPSASQAPWTTSRPTSRCQASCSAGRLQITGENLHALRRPSRWLGSLDEEKIECPPEASRPSPSTGGAGLTPCGRVKGRNLSGSFAQKIVIFWRAAGEKIRFSHFSEKNRRFWRAHS